MILKVEDSAEMAAEPHPSLAEDCERGKKGENCDITTLFGIKKSTCLLPDQYQILNSKIPNPIYT